MFTDKQKEMCGGLRLNRQPPKHRDDIFLPETSHNISATGVTGDCGRWLLGAMKFSWAAPFVFPW